MHLLDTDTCVYWLKGDLDIERRAQQVGWDQIAISGMTTAELYYGAFKSHYADRNLNLLSAFLQRFTFWDALSQVDQIFGKTKADLERKGLPIGDADILIASFALHHRAVLVTNNLRDFQRIPDLQTENWRQKK